MPGHGWALRPTGAPLVGTVEAFDRARGLGSVRVTDGATTYPFHCTALADGSRSIEPGTPVTFVLSPGLGGQVEAAHVTRTG